MNILEMQDAIKAAGWQWIERVYNDGRITDCFIEFTRTTNPHVFSEYPRPIDCLGWGRFRRQDAWQMAYNRLILGIPS